MAGAFLWDDKVGASLSITSLGVAPPAGMPLSNLIDPQPRMRARFVATTASVLVDFGASTSVEAVALIGTALSSVATIRWQQGDIVGSYTFDSGTLAADTTDAAGGNVVVLNSVAVAGRYLQIDVADASATQIDIGRLVAGPVWRLTRAVAYGVQEGRANLDRVDRNPYTGASFPAPAVVNPRFVAFTLPLMTTAEVIGEHRRMLAALGAAGDALWLPDTGLSRAEMNQRGIWGPVAEPGADAATARIAYGYASRNFRIVERI